MLSQETKAPARNADPVTLAFFIYRWSSIIHRWLSIIHHPSSIIHRPSAIIASLWGDCKIILGSFWDDFGIILGSCWGHVGVILGSLWDHVWITLGSCWGHIGVSFPSRPNLAPPERTARLSPERPPPDRRQIGSQIGGPARTAGTSERPERQNARTITASQIDCV